MNSFSQRVRTLLGVALLAGACGVLQAAPTSSTFEPTQVVQGTTLKLNGAGTRYKVVFKLYDLALYTQSKVSTPEELLALPGPKRLNFVALRDLPGTDLGLVFIKGLSANSSPELVRKHTVSSNRLVEIFSGRSKLTAGDTFAMEYVPGKGTTFYIQGQAQGAPLGDAEYFGMVLKIWVGSSPADFKLKDALLGQ
mgnify:FL=1|jgi:hypothetical protein